MYNKTTISVNKFTIYFALHYSPNKTELSAIYMLQAIEETIHFWKWLGISGNARSFRNCIVICRKYILNLIA